MIRGEQEWSGRGHAQGVVDPESPEASDLADQEAGELVEHEMRERSARHFSAKRVEHQPRVSGVSGS